MVSEITRKVDDTIYKAKLKILFVSEERRYIRIVEELRKTHHIDYIFKDSKWSKEGCNYHIPKLLNRHIGFKFLSFIFVHYLLLAKKYDICVTDYRSIFQPSIFLVLKKVTNSIKTNFIHDLRTIPVEYNEHLAKTIEKRFSLQLRFANRFYQGITLITYEMKKYIKISTFNLKNHSAFGNLALI